MRQPTLAPGDRFGSYEVIELIGAGGMGEVYRARDTRLSRDVALKVLPDHRRLDPERRVRFEREAQLLSSLNHPNIATLHGIEDAHDVSALVMELVEGETLAELLSPADGERARGADTGRRRPLPMRLALEIARQIADALDSAHERGIIHRDLKPGNIKVRPDGTVKVLDFGLARTVIDRSRIDASADTHSVSNAGVIVGTVAYMSPEQARGAEVDRRTDIWAFGCVLYEMLTGQRAFGGKTDSDTLANVFDTAPEFAALPVQTPPAVRRLLRRCLEPDLKRRLRAIADAWPELDDAPEADARRPDARGWSRRQALFGLSAAAAIGAAASAAGMWRFASSPKSERLRYFFTVPDGTRIALPPAYRAAVSAGVLSPDGSAVAFVAEDPSKAFRLWVYHRDSFEASPLPGTDGAAFPFWSPNGDRLGFFSGDELRVTDLAGGAARVLCRAPQPGGGTWSRQHEIVFSASVLEGNALFRVGDRGGDPTPITPYSDPRNSSRRFPEFLPDGQSLLFYVAAWAQPKLRGVYVGALGARDEARLPIDADTAALYSDEGYLLFGRGGTLYAQRFDASSRTPQGNVVVVADSIQQGFSDRGAPSFSISRTGDLAYRPGVLPREVQWTWWDRRTRQAVQKVGPPGVYAGVDVARDGRIVVHRHERKGGVLFVIEVDGRITPITSDPAEDSSSPIFSPDDRRVAFAARQGDTWGLFVKPSDGSGTATRLFTADGPMAPMGWYANTLLFWNQNPKTSHDIWQISTDAPGEPVPLLNSTAAETHAQTPDSGTWMTYKAGREGPLNVYVQFLTPGAMPVPISPGGGVDPRVRRDGTEVFYRPVFESGQVRSVSIRTQGDRFIFGPPVTLFEASFFVPEHDGNFYGFAVHPDGQRFLMPEPVRQADDTAAARIAIVDDWLSLIDNR